VWHEEVLVKDHTPESAIGYDVVPACHKHCFIYVLAVAVIVIEAEFHIYVWDTQLLLLGPVHILLAWFHIAFHPEVKYQNYPEEWRVVPEIHDQVVPEYYIFNPEGN